MPNLDKLAPISLLILSICLTSCASIPISTVDQRIKAWEKASIDEVIEFWGVPTKTSRVNDNQYAEWRNSKHESGNSSVSIGSGTRIRGGSIGVGLTLFDLGGSDDKCSRIVRYLKSGEIVEIIWKGTQDFCYKLTPDRAEVMANRQAIQEQSNHK